MANAFYNPASAEYLNPEKKRRVAIVTGGNSGIGWYTVLHLYLHGYVVYVAGRTESKVLKAIEEIKAEAEKRYNLFTEDEKVGKFLGTLSFIHFDCCDLKSVETCAKEFVAKEPKLHILINNAGIMGVPYEITKDGYEIQYQVNFVAPFLFTLKLLPALQNATKDAKPRVVCLSSMGHNMAYKYFEPTDTMKKFPDSLFTWVRYGNAKAAEIEFMNKFAKEYPDIAAFSVHPGVIFETELMRYWKNLPVIGFFTRLSARATSSFMGISMEEGCLASLRAVLDPELEDKSGIYLQDGGAIGKPSAIVQKPANIERTWTENIRMLEERGFTISAGSS